MFYPKGIQDKGTIRTQYGHVIDVLPTTLEFLGINAPQSIRGIKQDAIQGTSLVYSFNNASAAFQDTPSSITTFLVVVLLYKDGWKAAVLHHPDYIDERLKDSTQRTAIVRDYDKEVWELYNLNDDFNERVDLAKKHPEKLKELQAQFDADAQNYHLYPFIDWDDVLNKRIHQNGLTADASQKPIINNDKNSK